MGYYRSLHVLTYSSPYRRSADWVENARETGAYFRKALADALAGHPNVGDVRGEGMLAAVELVEDKAARRLYDPAKKVGPQVAAAMLEKGVIARAMPQGRSEEHTSDLQSLMRISYAVFCLK